MSAAPEQPRFMLDHMLVKLGKYLRILGCDADWDLERRTQDLIRKANCDQRVFLTRNTKLGDEYPRVERAFLLRSQDPVVQLRAVIAEFGIDPERDLFSRCVQCNVELSAVADKAEIRDAVHPNVYKRYDRFYTCPDCGTVFWKGSHVRNTCRKLGLEMPCGHG